MRLPLENDKVLCPRNNKKSTLGECRICAFLGFVDVENVACRWSKEKEQFLNKERWYN